MGWNYRVMRHTTDPKGAWFAMHEVHYRDDSVDDRTATAAETGYTAAPAVVQGDSVDDLRETLLLMLEA